MSHFAYIRQQQSWGRRALGLFVAVWLNLAMQPCAMAYEAQDDHGCPHCPPAETHEHGEMHGGMDETMPCADGAADCALDEGWSHDGRSGTVKLKDAPVDALIAIVPQEPALQFLQTGRTTLIPYRTPAHAGASPPLHVLYCVYLD